MQKKEERKQRLSLTLLFSVTVILIFIIVLLLAGFGLYFLLEIGVLTSLESGEEVLTTELILTFVAACTIVGSTMTFLISRYPLKPVNGLMNIMGRLASGDFTARIRITQPWDRFPGLVELADNFNKMAEELQNTELLRSDFINNFSHEFKTPIVSIAGFAKLLKRERLTPQQMGYVRIIEEESLRLSDMATNVLDMTRVENQTILTDVSTYNLSEQLRTCILLLSSKWEKKELDFALDFHEHMITGNEELLKHVWLNLIDNAVKFSLQGGVVEVTIAESTQMLTVCVSNRGITIPPEKQQRIFNKFYQADESHATQGNGIGLAIVKKVVALHLGSVSVRSEEGKTDFFVQLPKQKPGTAS